MHVPAQLLQRAVDIYLQAAYPGGAPAAVGERLAALRALPGGDVPAELLERDVADSGVSLALRLGQPMYPYMKLVLDPMPVKASGAEGAPGASTGRGRATCQGQDFLMSVDAHDQHLHAPAGSPDAAWLAGVRLSNKDLCERIEAAWAAAGLPTFKEYLRRELDARRKAGVAGRPDHRGQ